MSNRTKAFYTVPEVSRASGLTQSHLYDLLKKRLMPGTRLEARSRWLIPAGAFDAWLCGKTQEATARLQAAGESEVQDASS